MLAGVNQARQHLVEVIDLFGVARQQAVQILRRVGGRGGRRHPEKARLIGGNGFHVLLEAVQDAGFFLIDLREKAGFVVVGLDPARRLGAEGAGMLHQLFQHGGVKPAFGGHAGNDAGAADGDVGAFVGQEQGGADAVIAAASGVGAVDPRQHRNAQLVQLGVAKERRAGAAPVGVKLLLLVQFRPAAIH